MVNENDFDKLMDSILSDDVRKRNEDLGNAVDAYNDVEELIPAICGVCHTWCEEHNMHPAQFFEQAFMLVGIMTGTLNLGDFLGNEED
jgi:hypothetical protein